MRSTDDEGLSLPQGEGRDRPKDHTRICWASACGEAGRGRPPEPWDVADERARQLIADGFCACKPLNKGGTSRAGRNRSGRGRGQWG